MCEKGVHICCRKQTMKQHDSTYLSKLSQALGLRGSELVHPPLEVLKVSLNCVPLLHQKAVPLRVLFHILGDLWRGKAL